MGQLIKLQDYVSRYEQKIYFYPSRFVALKKQQWEKIYAQWERGKQLDFQEEAIDDFQFEEEPKPFIDKVKSFLKFGKKEEEQEEMEDTRESDREEDGFSLEISPSFLYWPETEEDLKRMFLNQLFQHQIRWASTTLTEKSNVDKKYFFNEELKYLLQRFPDTFLILFHPVFLLKKAPVEGDIVMLTPTEAWCLSFLEEEDLACFFGSNERFWEKKIGDKEEKVLNPLLSLNRTGKIVKNIFRMNEVELPLRKALISRNGYIEYSYSPYDVELIDRRSYDKWFQYMRNQKTPFKFNQFKAAEALLEYCETVSMKRLEWELNGNLPE